MKSGLTVWYFNKYPLDDHFYQLLTILSFCDQESENSFILGYFFIHFKGSLKFDVIGVCF